MSARVQPRTVTPDQLEAVEMYLGDIYGDTETGAYESARKVLHLLGYPVAGEDPPSITPTEGD